MSKKVKKPITKEELEAWVANVKAWVAEREQELVTFDSSNPPPNPDPPPSH